MPPEYRFKTDDYCKALKWPETETEKLKQRVEIAKDVLSFLKTKRLFARNGTYLGSYSHEWKEQFIFTAQKDLERDWDKPILPPNEAYTCAIGSVFVAALDKYDVLSHGDMEEPGDQPNDEDMVAYLAPWWNEEELRYIEIVFENDEWQYLESHEHDESLEAEMLEAYRFKHDVINRDNGKTTTAEAVLIAIMENIIEHRGELVV